jgi:hypothetical protein
MGRAWSPPFLFGASLRSVGKTPSRKPEEVYTRPAIVCRVPIVLSVSAWPKCIA